MIEYNDVTIRLIKPRAKVNIDFEQYYLTWVSVDGGVKDWLFTPPNNTKRNTGNNLIENDTIFRQIPNKDLKTVELIAGNLSRDQYEYISDISISNRVELTTSEGEIVEVAINDYSDDQSNDAHLYRIELTIQFRKGNLMKG